MVLWYQKRPVLRAFAVRALLCGGFFWGGFSLKAQAPSLAVPCLSYLNGLQTLSCSFLEKGPSGTKKGVLYFQRPRGKETCGFLRLKYSPPHEIDVLVRDHTLFYYRRQEEALDGLNLKASPLSFFLRPRIAFDDEVRVESIEQTRYFTKIHLSSRHSASGMLTLFFHHHPFFLKKWILKDGQNNITELLFSEIKTNIPLPQDAFLLQKKTKP